MFFPKSGSETIKDAVGLFTTAIDKLNNGIELVKLEMDRSKSELVRETEKFESTKSTIETSIATHESDIESASKVKANIEKILA